MDIKKINKISEEIIRCNEQLSRMDVFNYPTSDEDIDKDKGVRPGFNIKIESPGAHIVIYALDRNEANATRHFLTKLLSQRVDDLSYRLNSAYSD